MNRNLFLLVLLVCHLCTEVAAAEQQIEAESEALAEVINSFSPRVVQLRYFGGVGQGATNPVTTASGILLDEQGWVLTSSYGLSLDPAAVTVVFQDGSQAAARIVSRDMGRSLVLLQTEALRNDTAQIQRPVDVRVGQRTIALGRALQHDKVQASVGVVSAVGRLSGRALQTDAAVSPMNYGGPLLNLRGELLGVLTPLAPPGQSAVDWYDSGIGFAIPWHDVTSRLDRMKQGETIHPGWLGVQFSDKQNQYTSPATIIRVAPGSSASVAGIVEKDRIVQFNDTPTPTLIAFRRLLRAHDAGERILLRVLRGEEIFETWAELGKRHTEEPKKEPDALLQERRVP